MKKKLTALSAAVLLLAAVAALAINYFNYSQNNLGLILEYDNEEKQKETLLTFFGYKADSLNLIAIEAALHGFMDEHPDINICYEGVKGLPYWVSFDRRDAAGILDDIVNINHDRVQKLGAEGKLEDLSDIAAKTDFNAMMRKQFENKDGKVYFLPMCISTFNLYINYDLLEKHGQKIPENLGEFTKTCDYFVSQGITPIVANDTSSLRSLMMAKSMYRFYADGTDAEEIEKINSGEEDFAELMRPGIELAEMMVKKGWIDAEEALAAGQTAEDLEIFSAGDRPFMVTGGWASPRVAAFNPDLNYGEYPFPIFDDGSVLVMDANTCISVNSQGSHVSEAKELIEYMLRKDVMWEYCDSQSSYSPINDDRTLSDKAIVPSTAYLTNGRSVISSDYRIEIPVDNLLNECGLSILNGAGTEETVALLRELLKNI